MWIIRNSKTLTDWARVFADADSDAPTAYDPNDDDELYDPNDDAAVEACWRQGIREGRVTRGIGKDAVVLKLEDFEWGRQELKDQVDTLTP